MQIRKWIYAIGLLAVIAYLIIKGVNYGGDNKTSTISWALYVTEIIVMIGITMISLKLGGQTLDTRVAEKQYAIRLRVIVYSSIVVISPVFQDIMSLAIIWQIILGIIIFFLFVWNIFVDGIARKNNMADQIEDLLDFSLLAIMFINILGHNKLGLKGGDNIYETGERLKEIKNAIATSAGEALRQFQFFFAVAMLCGMGWSQQGRRILEGNERN